MAAAPVASKVAAGADSLLGNDEIKGTMAFSTSISADKPRPGYYVVTDIVETSTDQSTTPKTGSACQKPAAK